MTGRQVPGNRKTKIKRAESENCHIGLVLRSPSNHNTKGCLHESQKAMSYSMGKRVVSFEASLSVLQWKLRLFLALLLAVNFISASICKQ